MIEYHGNSGVVIDTQRFLGINTPIMGSNWGQGPNKLGHSNEALAFYAESKAKSWPNGLISKSSANALFFRVDSDINGAEKRKK